MPPPDPAEADTAGATVDPSPLSGSRLHRPPAQAPHHHSHYAAAERPPLQHLLSDASTASSKSAGSVSNTSTEKTSLQSDSPTTHSASTCAPAATQAQPAAPMGEPISPYALAKRTNGALRAEAAGALPPEPNSPPLHTFPTFLLSLLTAIESDPATIRSHLDHLAGCRAAPAAFAALPQGKPAETDAIVQSLTRLADRLSDKEDEEEAREELVQQMEQAKLDEDTAEKRTPFPLTVSTTSGPPSAGTRTPSHDYPVPSTPTSSRPRLRSRPTTGDPTARRPFVPGDSLEEIRKNYEEQLHALRILHAEELYRAQVSHDNEVRYVQTLPQVGSCD